MNQIKNELIKQVDSNTVVTVKYGIYDDCGNGYNHFEFDCDLWGINGDRQYGEHKEYKGKRYYFVEDVMSLDEVKLYYPELVNVFLMKQKDSYGLGTYPILNGKYYLKTDIKHAAKFYGITLKEAKEISLYNDKALTEFILNRVIPNYKDSVNKAIAEIEATTGQKYTSTEKVSPVLYNDIHYTFVTEKEGWNVYKGNASKITKYPKIN